MWAALIPILSSILPSLFSSNSLIGQFFQNKALQIEAAQMLAIQVERDKLQMSMSVAQAAMESERNKLNATSQSFKALSFILLNIPIILTCMNKEWGAFIWANLGLVPVWYAQLYVSVVFVIWGLPVVSNATGTIFNAIQDMWNIRNDGKVAKYQAIAQANNQNIEDVKRHLFDVVKTTLGVKGYTQAQVDAINQAADALAASDNK